MDKFFIRSNKRSKIDYQQYKEGEKIKIEIKKNII
jgi:alpha-L-fucosidase 2